MTLLLLGAAVAAWPSIAPIRRVPEAAFDRRALPRRLGIGPSVLVGGWLVGGWTAATAAGAIGATAWFLWSRGTEAKRETGMRRDLAVAIEVLVGELRVGANPAAACAVAGEEGSGEVRRVLAAAASRSRLGGSCGSSLLAESAWPGEDLRRLGSAWQLAEECGIPVADVLDAARRDLAGRLRFDATVHSSLAGARATATVLSGLPVFGLALGEAMGARPVSVLLGGGFGGALLLTGCGFACAGLLWTHAITAGVRT